MKKKHLEKLGFNLFDYDPNKLESRDQAECFKLGKEFEINKEDHVISGIFQYEKNNCLFCSFYSGKMYFCISDPSSLSVTKGIIEICNNLKYDEKPDRQILNELIICIIKSYEKKDTSGLYY